MNAVELAKHKSAETLAESRADERSVAKGIASCVPAGGRKGIVCKGVGGGSVGKCRLGLARFVS